MDLSELKKENEHLKRQLIATQRALLMAQQQLIPFQLGHLDVLEQTLNDGETNNGDTTRSISEA